MLASTIGRPFAPSVTGAKRRSLIVDLALLLPTGFLRFVPCWFDAVSVSAIGTSVWVRSAVKCGFMGGSILLLGVCV